MKKITFKIVTATLAAVLAINSFSVNSKPASAEEIDSMETVETENSYGKLIYEHENEDGLIERVYLENTPDSYSTQSRRLNFYFTLSNSYGVIATNKMYNAWVYDGAVPTYPNLAAYTNTPKAGIASSITYSGSYTTYGEGAGLYYTTYHVEFSCVCGDWVYLFPCNVTFYSDGSFYANATGYEDLKS